MGFINGATFLFLRNFQVFLMSFPTFNLDLIKKKKFYIPEEAAFSLKTKN